MFHGTTLVTTEPTHNFLHVTMFMFTKFIHEINIGLTAFFLEIDNVLRLNSDGVVPSHAQQLNSSTARFSTLSQLWPGTTLCSILLFLYYGIEPRSLLPSLSFPPDNCLAKIEIFLFVVSKRIDFSEL